MRRGRALMRRVGDSFKGWGMPLMRRGKMPYEAE